MIFKALFGYTEEGQAEKVFLDKINEAIAVMKQARLHDYDDMENDFEFPFNDNENPKAYIATYCGAFSTENLGSLWFDYRLID